MTIDPTTKDIFIVNTCDTSVVSSSSTVSIKVQKITQNTTTKTAQTVTDIAGNCVKGNVSSGSLAINSPLENSLYQMAHGSLVYVPSVQALYLSTYGQKPVKIIGGKIYQSSSGVFGISMRGGVYIPQQNKVYYAQSGIVSFMPNANAAFDETVTVYIGAESSCVSSNCRQDGVDLSTAGVLSSSVFALGGQLGVIDNTYNNSTKVRLRVVDPSTNSLQTIAGTDRASGDGNDRTLARFGSLSSLVYKPTSSTGFPAGLYASDSGAYRISYMDPAGSNIVFKAGSGISKLPTNSSNFDTTLNLGSNSLFHLILSPSGFFTFGWSTIWNVAANGLTASYLSGGGNALNVTDGASSSTVVMGTSEMYSGLVYDSAGNLYYGGYQPTSGNLNRLMVRKTNGTLYTVIGTSANASSNDCTTAGCAHALSIVGNAYGWGANANPMGYYDNRYNSNEGRLLFAEGAKIRFVSRAYDPTNSKLGTLSDQSGTPINFGRSVGIFRYSYVDGTSEQIDKIYYVSGDGRLYCYKVSTGTDSKCNNTSLGPSSSIGNLHSGILEMDSSGYIYGVLTSLDAIYRYIP